MFVIPMAGKSNRFYEAGYDKPKYELKLGQKTIFEHAILSFKAYFTTDSFCFVVKDAAASRFVNELADKNGIKDYHNFVVPHETAGQAETVYLALGGIPDEELYIFNIDTFRPNFIKPRLDENIDGYVEVFEGEGDHWSFVEPGPQESVLRTTEKDRISSLCSTGLYYFASSEVFKSLVLEAMHNELKVKGEYYVAPLYNKLIERDGKIKYNLIPKDTVIFCGTPKDYNNLEMNYIQ